MATMRVPAQRAIAEPDCSAETFIVEQPDRLQTLSVAYHPVDVLPSWINIAL